MRRRSAGLALLAAFSLLAGCAGPAAQGPKPGPKHYREKAAAVPRWQPASTTSATFEATASSTAAQSLGAAYFLSPEAGFVAQASCGGASNCTTTLLATQDGGERWNALSTIPGRVGGLRFVNAQDGYAWGAKGLYRTTDGGATWTLALKSQWIGYVSFRTASDGWVSVGDPGNCATQGCPFKILGTTDGGQSWHAVAWNSLPAPAGQGGTAGAELPWAEFGGMGYLGQGRGFVFTRVPVADVEVTTDGGAHWKGTLGPASPQLSVSMLPGGTGWALLYPQEGTARAAGAYRTRDGGFTWTREDPPPPPWTRARTAADGSLWLLSRQAAGGYRLAQALGAKGGPPPLGAVFTALDPLTAEDAFAIAQGAQSTYLLKSVDQGVKWTAALSTHAPPVPHGATFWDQSDAIASDGGVGLLRTSDGGAHWRVFRDLPSGLAGSVGFSSPEDGWLLDAGGDIWLTGDGGATYQKIAQPAPPSMGGVTQAGFEDGAHGYAIVGGAPGSLYVTKSAGQSWRPSQSGVLSAAFATPGAGWALGQKGTLYRTVDGGADWRAVLRGVPKDFRTVLAPPGRPQAVWLWDALDGELAVSADGGKEFRIAEVPSYQASAVSGSPMPSSASAGLLDVGGSLWRTTDAGATWSLAVPGPSAE